MKNDFSIIYQLNVKLFQNSVLQFVQSVYLSFSLSIPNVRVNEGLPFVIPSYYPLDHSDLTFLLSILTFLLSILSKARNLKKFLHFVQRDSSLHSE